MPNYPYTFQLPPLNVQDIPNDGVAGEFLGINGSGVLDWLTAGGAGDMLKADNLSGLTSYPTARTNLGLGTGDSPTFANLTLTSPSLVSSAPVTISQTWNNAAVAFTGLKVNAAGTSDANSASSSLLADFQVNGVTKANIRKNGLIYSGFVFTSPIGFNISSNSDGSNQGAAFSLSGIAIPSGATIGFTSGNGSGFASPDTILLRDGAANTLALRNGTNAQTFNVYGTYTSGTSYERLTLSAPSAANAIIGTNKGSGGGTARGLDLHTDGAARMTITSAGLVGIGTTAPGSNLSVVGNMGVRNAATGLGTGYGIEFDTNSSLPRFSFVFNSTYSSVIEQLSDTLRIKTLGTTTNITFGSNSVPSQVVLKTDTGNLGIGTTAPSTLLHLHKDQNTDTELRVQNSSDLSSATATINLVGSQGSTLVLQANPTTVAAPDATRALIKSTANVFGINLKAESTVGTLQFYTGGGAAANERLRITAAGNLGIGTTSPTSNLTVAQSTTGVGTISVGAAGTTITGVGTQFLNTFAVGQTITSAGQTLTISAIASDTSMTISPAAGAAISGQAYTLVGGTRFTVAGNGKVGIGANLFLERDGDNLLALRNGGNAQTFRIYNTYSNAGVDVEYLQLSTSASGFRVGTNSSGSGSPRVLLLGVGGGSQWNINTSGHIGTFGSDNLYDIGASGANRPRNVYVGTSLFCGSNVRGLTLQADGGGGTGTYLSNTASADGVLAMVSFNGTSFNRLQFGGVSSSFPSIKRVGTELQVVIASTTAAIGVAAADADMTFIEDRYRRKGAGTPEAAVTAPIGAVFHRTDGGAGTSFYVKESGTGNTGWVGK